MANGQSRFWTVAVVLVAGVAVAGLLLSIAVFRASTKTARRLNSVQVRLSEPVMMPEALSETQAQPNATAAPGQTAPQTQSAEHTRKQWTALLDRRPPSLARVLKADPTLMTNQSYLAAYPEIAQFISWHPEITKDPAYFFENVNTGLSYTYRFDPKVEALRFWQNMIGGIGAILVVLMLLSGVIWLVKLIVEHRGSYQQWKTQTEVHNKLLDRFSSNEELLAYVQSPAGLRFLETAPVAAAATRDVNVPLRKVLWAVQVGVVLLATGVGLMVVNNHVIEEMQQPLFALGAVVAFLGGGFVVSGAISYALSRRLGLLKSQ